MRRTVSALVLMLGLAACQQDVIFVEDDQFVGDDVPAAPRALGASYYAGAVTVTWELAPAWNGEAFRVYSRRVTDASYFFIAEVTSCIAGFCSYVDTNITGGETYDYIVSSVSPNSGIETDSDFSVEVFVPVATAPPIPNVPSVIALDDANYFSWGDASRVGASDFSHYKVYLDEGGTTFLLGETDSEGFLDLLAVNGETYAYFVSAVDSDGHESDGSPLAVGTPRPDYHGEWLYDFADQPEFSGFRFAEDEVTNPVLSGTDPNRHFRLETDLSGWWLVPNSPNATVYPTGFVTTALKCGVAADEQCTDVTNAPTAGFVSQDVQLFTQESYVLRVVGDDQQIHYAVIRLDLLGFDQEGDAIMIFDWAYQVQAGNPNLVSPVGG